MNQKKATAKEKDPSNENKESVAAGTQVIGIRRQRRRRGDGSCSFNAREHSISWNSVLQSEPVSIPAVSPGSNPKKARTPAQLLAQAARAFSSQGRLRRLKFVQLCVCVPLVNFEDVNSCLIRRRSLEELGGSQLSEVCC